MTAVAYLISDKWNALTIDSVVKLEEASGPSFRYVNKIRTDFSSRYSITLLGNEVVLTSASLLQSWYEEKKKTLDYETFEFIDELTRSSNYLKDAYDNKGTSVPKQDATLYFFSSSKCFLWNLKQNEKGYFYSKQERPVHLLKNKGAINYGGSGPLYFDLPQNFSNLNSMEIHEFLKKKIADTHEEFRKRKEEGANGFLDYEFNGLFSGIAYSIDSNQFDVFPPFEYLSDQIHGLIDGVKNNDVVLSTDIARKWSPAKA